MLVNNQEKIAEIPEIVGYARVSTVEQSQNSHALEQQIARLKSAGVELVLVDVESGREGKESDRPNFQKMMNLVRRGLVKQIYITRLDRLSRSLPTLRKVLDQFHKSNCTLIALDDNIDLSTAAGKFHVNMLGALAEMESDRLAERIRHGKEHFRQQKRASHAPFGYKIENARHVLDRIPFLSVDGQEMSRADIARDLVRAYLELKSLSKTCRWFVEKYGWQQFWSTALREWLTSPVLQGHLVYYRKSKKDATEIHYNTHEPLISESEAREIQQIIAFNKRVGGFGAVRGVYPLTGLVQCGVCGGGAVIANGTKGKHKYFICAKSRFKTCLHNKGTRVEKLDEAVVNALVSRAEAIANLAINPNSEPDSPELLQLLIQLDSLRAIPGDNPAIQKAISQLESQITQLRYSLSQLPKINSNSLDLLLWAFSDPKCWKDASDEDKKRVYRELLHKAIIKNGEVVEVKLKI